MAVGPFIFLDTETTGIDPNRNSIIEIACIKWENGKALQHFESLINPHHPIPQEITLITGIDDSMVSAAPFFSAIKNRIVDFIGSAPVIGHNIPFDLAFLKSHHLELKNPSMDTLSLARILLRKEASYALEVLIKKYGLPVRTSHRAMADTENSIDLFEFLLGKIAEIPAETKKIIDGVAAKSDWAGGQIFREIKTVKKPRRINKSKDTAQKAHAQEPRWTNGTLDAFFANAKILLETPNAIPFEKFKNRKLFISYAKLSTRGELQQQAENCGISAYVLKDPYFYLSREKLAEKLKQENFSAAETPFLLKMVLWNSETETGDREEISLEREEYGLFQTLADEDGTGGFFKKALAGAGESDVILIHHGGLAKGLAEYTNNAENRDLIILDAAQLEDAFTNAYRKKYTDNVLRPVFGEKSTMIFGLLGIFHERNSELDYSGMLGNAVINNDSKQTVEWKRAYYAILNLPQHAKKQEFLADIESDGNCIQWVSQFLEEVSLNKAPISIKEIFRTHVVQKFKKILLADAALSVDGTFNFISGILGLDDKWQKIIEENEPGGNLDIKIPEKFPEPMTVGYFKRCLKLFEEIMETKKGRALFLLGSKKMVQSMYSNLLKKALDEKIKLLAVGTSGGTGKTLALFLENPQNSIMLATAQIIPFMEEIESQIETIVFQKIPFDPPNDILIKLRGNQFKNAFTQYFLPRAVLKFKNLMRELAKGKPKICHILDSRLLSRDYGNLFIR